MKACPICGKQCARLIGGNPTYYCSKDGIHFDEAGNIIPTEGKGEKRG